MKRIAVIAEGLGDVNSIPTLVAKTSQAFGHQIFAVRVLKSGGWLKLRQVGQLERFCILAVSHGDVDAVLVLSDLDDDCAKNEYQSSLQRLSDIEKTIGIPVSLCFCVREYETWFLQDIQSIIDKSNELEIKTHEHPNPEGIRGAKEFFSALIGSKYRETVDQRKFTQRIDPVKLINKSRSYRKLVTCLIG